MSNHAAPTADDTFPLTDATDDNGFPATYADPADTNQQDPAVSTATADSPAAPANGKPATPPKAPKTKTVNKAKKKAAKAAAKSAAKPADAPAANGTPTAAKPEKAAKAPKVKAVPKPRTYGGFKKPVGKITTLPVKELVLDRRLQTRASIYDDPTVENYKELHLQDPDLLPPVDVVDIGEEEAEARNLPSRYVVWDGFQRTEARRRAKLAEIRCNVVVGSWDQARYWSLSANATHGLPRTSADIRKAFQRFLEDEELKDAVLKAAKGKGGANRAISAALGVSTGMVSKTLNALGLTTRGDKIITLKKSDDATPPAPHGRAADPSPGLRVESKEAIKSRLTAAIVKEMAFAAAQLQRRYESLLERDDIKGLFREVAHKNGIDVVTDQTPTSGGKVTVTEYWPAVDVLLKTLEELDAQFTAMNTGTSK